MKDPKEIIIQTNKYQTPVTREFMEEMSAESQADFLEFVTSIPYIKWMISPDRPHAKDLPRDEQGRAIIDVTRPPILDDMDYFRQAAKFYEENGCYTFLKPNPCPGSEYDRWFKEEVRRCREGYVRESDGMWITGKNYFYQNYGRMKIAKTDPKTGISAQVESLPLVWDGIVLRNHYHLQARLAGEHCIELARRGASKSYSIASDMTHDLLLGENEFAKTAVNSILTAANKEYLADKDGTLNKFVVMKDFCALNTEFPRMLIKNSPSEMLWKAGYLDKNGNAHGSNNIVMGVSIADDEGKVRGKRGLIYFEEMGSFPRLREVYNNVRDSVKDGDITFAQIQLVGTSGDKDSDFAGAKIIMYHPKKFGIHALPNVYDLPGNGGDLFGYFFPAYISRTGCIDKDGNSDVTLAIKRILMDRDNVGKKGDPDRIKVTAERPITPAEAMMRVKDNFFPVVALNERLRQLDTDPRAFDDVYVGTLLNMGGKVSFIASTDHSPLRQWRPMPQDKTGAVEIWEMPINGRDGEPPRGRYVIGVDPVDNDEAESESLFSCFVMDLYTDRLVAEYTGRHKFAEENYEIALNLSIFYNAIVMYENNKKGLYAFFARNRMTWRLADCPEYLRDRQLVKYSMFGSSAKGVNVNNTLNNTALEQMRDWLNKPVMMSFRELNKETNMMDTVERRIPILYSLRSPAFIHELTSYGKGNNTDRVSAVAQIMLYREQFIIDTGGDVDKDSVDTPDETSDEFFDKGFDQYQKKHGKVSI